MASFIYEQTDFPIFQNRMYPSRAEARDCPRGNIQLAQDPETGIISNTAFQAELMTYDRHYQNEQGNSTTFQQHLKTVADIVVRRLGSQRLVEVGCGKGYFLNVLADRGVNVTGFDPTYEGPDNNIRKEYFSPGIIDRADGLILRHVLEHVQHPVDFLQQISNANGNNGLIYIEVPCFDWICTHKAWFDIFYEHVNYFRLDDFRRIFGTIIESGHLFGGQYIYVVADLASLRQPAPRTESSDFKLDFSESLLKFSKFEDRPKIVWGGASKGVIFSLLMERFGSPVTSVIDINPAKQGKFMAGTGLKVNAPEDVLPLLPRNSLIYVMNSNYLEEIKQMTQHAFTYIGVDND